MTIITAVAKKKEDTSVQKGELMLNNVDLMEVGLSGIIRYIGTERRNYVE